MSYDLWGRLRYMLSPQFDIYEKVAEVVYGDVLDVGSGTGFGTHLLVRNANSVIGYEIDHTARHFAKRAFSNGNIGFQGVDIAAPMYAGNYDCITMIDVIEHIEEDASAIRNCCKLLKEGGTFICSTPNKLSRYRKSEYHVREYSPQELKALLSKFFENVRILNFELKQITSDYENPMVAICKGAL